MSLILEKEGTRRTSLEINSIEPFTQKNFNDLIKDSHERKFDYFLAHVIFTQNDTKQSCCYDARQLCKYVFEMIISPEGRKIEIKNFKDPITKCIISELAFFRMRYDSDTPLRAEYIGSHKDFLESNCFRSKLFYREDPLYALSVSFNFVDTKRMPLFSKRQVFSLFITIVFILLVSSFLVLVLEKESKIMGVPGVTMKHKLD